MINAYIIHRSYDIINPEYIYIKDKNNGLRWWYKANYLKQFQEETIISKDRYLYY